jgi:glyoxylase-like metal-dependent hydrolase (beta-lactamase superfamily II)
MTERADVALPPYATLVRAANPGPMTLDGTNSWLLDGGDGVVVVDPGPLDDAHLRRLTRAPVRLILLTHGHLDHAEGADRCRALADAPVRALDPALCRGAAPLADAETVEIGADLRLRVLATPGHSGDSTSFLVDDERAPAVLTGDTILGRGTTVVAHPDGRLVDYLASLQRLRALAEERSNLVLLTGHGPVRHDALAVVDEYLQHRAERLAEVAAAVAAGAETPADVVRVVYADVDRAVWPYAELSVRAQLEHLAAQRGTGAG